MTRDVTDDGRWLSEHHSTNGVPCGWEVRIKNQRLRVVRGPNAQPVACGNCIDEDNEPTVTAELGWCGCGDSDAVDAMMLAYLTNLHERATTRKDEGPPHWGFRPTDGVSPDAEMLIQYMADNLGWTEHGGSVGGAWLTDDGRDALAALRLRA